MSARIAAQRQAKIAAASTPLSAALRRWATAYVRSQLAAARRDPRGYAATQKQKPKDLPDEERELARLLYTYGLTRAADVATEQAGGKVVLAGRAFSDAIAGKPIKMKVFQELRNGSLVRAQSIAKETRDRIKTQIRGAISDGGTTGDIMRALTQIRVPEAKRTDEDPAKVYAFSWARAELIARTELTQAENTGILAGLEVAGVDDLEWFSYSDGRSGERHHERMNGKRWRRGTTITTPNGNKLRYPGDPSAPVEDAVNCRCTFGAARKGPTAGA